MLITGFPSELTATNCWVAAPGDGEQCVIIDPGIGVGPQLSDILTDHRLHPIAVLLTHGHLDHTFSVVPICQATDVPAYIHPADRVQLSDPLPWLGLAPGEELLPGISYAEPADVRELTDGADVPLGGLTFRVRHAPGHTEGSVVFGLGEAGRDGADVLFSGDLLFAGSIGRTDLRGGSMTQMRTSLHDVILPLPDQTEVHPGHGPSTSIARERRTNPFLLELR